MIIMIVIITIIVIIPQIPPSYLTIKTIIFYRLDSIDIVYILLATNELIVCLCLYGVNNSLL